MAARCGGLIFALAGTLFAWVDCCVDLKTEFGADAAGPAGEGLGRLVTSVGDSLTDQLFVVGGWEERHSLLGVTAERGSIDDAFGAVSSFLTPVRLIAMLWFTIGLALLLRRYDGAPRGGRRSSPAQGSSALSPARSPRGTPLRSGARHRPASGPIRLRPRQLVVRERLGRHWAVSICAGMIFLSAMTCRIGSAGGRSPPAWVRCSRAIWTNDLVFVAFTAFWLWVAVVSVLLLTGRLAVAETY